MPEPSLSDIEGPQRIKLSAEDYAQIDPADAEAWAEPNQLWMSNGLVMTFRPADLDGLWSFRLHVIFFPDDPEEITGCLRDAMHAFWRAERPDFVSTDIEDHPRAVGVLERVGFKAYGILPLSAGERILMGWRLQQ